MHFLSNGMKIEHLFIIFSKEMINSIKISLIALSVVISFSSLYAEKQEDKKNEPKWYSWNEGYAKSLKDKDKIIVVDVFTDWCGWCKRMDKDTYAKKEIQDIMNKKFIPIKFNPEEPGTYEVDNMKLTGPQLLSMLTNNQRSGYPTIIFLYPKVREIDLQPGYQNAEQFKLSLDKALVRAEGTSK
jgi:thioredoxin-related protein